MTSTMASGAPLKVIACAWNPALRRKRSIARWIGLPTPIDPNVIGRCFPSATSSCTVLMFFDGAMTRTIGQISERRDRDKILDRIIRQVGDCGGRDDVSRGMGQQRVAVGIRHGDGARGDRAACARLVFDDDRLPELSRQLLENNSWNDVGRASRAQRYDRADGPAWPLVGAADGDAGEGGKCDCENQSSLGCACRSPEIRLLLEYNSSYVRIEGRSTFLI